LIYFSPSSPLLSFHILTNAWTVEGSAVATLLGAGHEGGADEDDFHTIRRKNAEVDREEHGEERARKEAKVRAGAFTGIVKAFGKNPVKPKKVVNF
jgi:zinc finger CCHC domain-containing protein 9